MPPRLLLAHRLRIIAAAAGGGWSSNQLEKELRRASIIVAETSQA